MKDLILHDVAKLAKKLGILNEIKYRDLCIYYEFIDLQKQGNKNEQIEIELGKKYSISPESVHRIVFLIKGSQKRTSNKKILRNPSRINGK